MSQNLSSAAVVIGALRVNYMFLIAVRQDVLKVVVLELAINLALYVFYGVQSIKSILFYEDEGWISHI